MVDGVPTCCAFPSQRAHLALAGLKEGSIALWDLREEANKHRSVALEPTSEGAAPGSSDAFLTVRTPTFTTDCLVHENHEAPVVAVRAVGKGKQSAQAMEMDNFDIMTLSQSGSGGLQVPPLLLLLSSPLLFPHSFPSPITLTSLHALVP